MFSIETYVSRRNKIKHLVKSGIILLIGNELSPINYKDNTYPFRQDSTFLYFFGINKPSLIGLIDIENDLEILVGDEQDLDDIIWTGKLPTLSELGYEVGISKVLPRNSLTKYLLDHSKNRKLHHTPAYRADNRTFLNQILSEIGHTYNPSADLIQGIVALRAIKEETEIQQLNTAVKLSEKIHAAIIQYGRPGLKEYELVGKLEGLALANNARMAYPTILTTHGQTLHNHYHGNTIQEGDLILCDAGVELESGYCGDLTRTFPASNKFTTKQLEIYNIVRTALESSEELLAPGIKFYDVHIHACTMLAQGLTEIGLMKGNPKDAVHAGAHTLFFQCGLGHMIGLDVHDMEDLGEDFVGYANQIKRNTAFGFKSLRLARSLENGFALTVEPGIYFIPEQIDLWKAEHQHESFINYSLLEKYRTFGGIRIENNYIIQNKGIKLGENLPADAAGIEALKNSP